MSSDRIPPETRPRVYSSVALLLDLMHIAREATALDHESIMIACAVNEYSMRPLLAGPGAPLDLVDLAEPPEEFRAGITRMAVAEITGLPRETVRRKINILIESGWLFEDPDGNVRAVRNLINPLWQKVADDSFSAVQAYDRRLRAAGCKGVSQ